MAQSLQRRNSAIHILIFFVNTVSIRNLLTSSTSKAGNSITSLLPTLGLYPRPALGNAADIAPASSNLFSANERVDVNETLTQLTSADIWHSALVCRQRRKAWRQASIVRPSFLHCLCTIWTYPAGRPLQVTVSTRMPNW